ncbi:MAG: ABC transporter ATP-binding protein [Lachnospiraceae bacterium]|nr:ABC transporter ATP-binding protein [Lachnospiraceae bacterium]
MIKINNLNFRYNKEQKVLNNINLEISDGETVGVIGANGAGKSTFLKLLVGLLTDYDGEIFIDDIKMEKKNLNKIRSKVGFVFQDSEAQLFMSTVYDDVAFGPRNMGITGEELDRRVMDALRQVGIEDLKDRQIYRMSGGQKKLASIATILSMKPSIILLDEPSIALDPKNRRNLIKVLNDMPGTKIIASHDLELIGKTCQKVVFIDDGSIFYMGETKHIVDDEKLLQEHGL